VQQLLEAGHDVNSTTACTQLTPLHLASQYGHEHVLHLLLQQPGVNVNAETEPDMQVGLGLGRSLLLEQRKSRLACMLHLMCR
jgi:ankyrin repeat protein